MDLLLDTHTFLWFIWDNPNLSSTAKGLISDSSNLSMLSIASLWELAIKVNTGKLTIGLRFEDFIAQYVLPSKIKRLGIDLNHIAEVSKLPHYHRDPFDRLLIAQAITENLTILSRDTAFDSYNITRIW